MFTKRWLCRRKSPTKPRSSMHNLLVFWHGHSPLEAISIDTVVQPRWSQMTIAEVTFANRFCYLNSIPQINPGPASQGACSSGFACFTTWMELWEICSFDWSILLDPEEAQCRNLPPQIFVNEAHSKSRLREEAHTRLKTGWNSAVTISKFIGFFFFNLNSTSIFFWRGYQQIGTKTTNVIGSYLKETITTRQNPHEGGPSW